MSRWKNSNGSPLFYKPSNLTLAPKLSLLSILTGRMAPAKSMSSLTDYWLIWYNLCCSLSTIGCKRANLLISTRNSSLKRKKKSTKLCNGSKNTVLWKLTFPTFSTKIPLSWFLTQVFFNSIQGKTIHFLKNKCKCNYSIPIPFINPSKILNYDICESSNILSPEFKKWLTSVYEDLSEKLVTEMKQRYNLKYHLGSMKYFFLMGKGDFIQQLVDTLKEEMAKPKHLVY